MIIAVDPGKNKCGVAVVKEDLTVEYKEVVATNELKLRLKQLQTEYQIEELVLGDGTKSQELQQEVIDIFKKINIVNESHSTLEARDLYWQEQPPSGWRRLIPTSLQTPQQPIDDYVAIILANRYFTSH
ncbi:Holliday junction resolvase RuvX [Halanaerocella petrolearia]